MNVSLDYKFYLTNVNWTNEYKNVLFFGNDNARNAYFDVANIFNNIKEKHNFNVTNLYKTTVVLDSGNIDYMTALQSNYLIVCRYDEDDQTKNEYYFYFITKARQCNFNRLELDIELDVFQQYYNSVTLPDCPINRGKVNISIKDGTKYYLNPDISYAENSEPIDLPLIFNKKYNLDTDSNVEKIMSIVHGFMYIFVDPSYNFEFKTIEEPPTTSIYYKIGGYETKPEKQGGIYNNIGVLCAPIYNSSTKIKITVSNTNDEVVLADANVFLQNLMNGHGGADAAHIYTVKISRRPPFTPSFIGYVGTISGGYLPITCNGSNVDQLYLYETDGVTACTSVVNSNDNYGLRFIIDTNAPYTFSHSFTPDAIHGSNPVNAKDPAAKLSSSQYTKAYIDFGDGNKMELDFARSYERVDHTKITYKYKEAITPDITRYSVCIDTEYYKGVNVLDVNGGIEVNNQTFTADMTLIFTIDQWAAFLANNKNFYAQGNFNTMMKINKGIVSGAAGAAGMNIGRSVASIANIYADTLQYAQNREYQVDNLKDSVDRVINQNGSACFNLIVKGIKPAIVTYTLIYETQIITYLKRFGVNTKSLFGNIKHIQTQNSFDTDYHYAYIQADVDEISSGTMSIECEQRFIQIFRDGVRFWYDPAKMYDYTY